MYVCVWPCINPHSPPLLPSPTPSPIHLHYYHPQYNSYCTSSANISNYFILFFCHKLELDWVPPSFSVKPTMYFFIIRRPACTVFLHTVLWNFSLKLLLTFVTFMFVSCYFEFDALLWQHHFTNKYFEQVILKSHLIFLKILSKCKVRLMI